MREIAAKGSIEDSTFIQYMIDGIRDAHTNKAMLYGAKKLKEFKEKLRTYEEFYKKQNMQNEILTTRQRIYDERAAEKKQSNMINQNDAKSVLKCYNCGARGHMSSICQNKTKGPKCFRCNNYGHLARDCQNKKDEISERNARCVTTKKCKDPYVVKKVKANNTYDVDKLVNFEGPNKTTTCAEYMKTWPETDTDLSCRKDQ